MFYNNLTSNFFNPFILQPTRLVSKTLIDNIFINSIDYTSFSGNLTIQLSDHLFQFTILEGFFKEILPKKINIYGRNFKHFSEQEFNDSLLNTNLAELLNLENGDPNISMNNFHQHINNLLDKLSKKELKLKQRSLINNSIQYHMKRRDNFLRSYTKLNNKESREAQAILKDYKVVKNLVTKMKRDSKIEYYKKFFENNKYKVSSIWKGIRIIVNINSKSKIINNKGVKLTDPLKIAKLFNEHC